MSVTVVWLLCSSPWQTGHENLPLPWWWLSCVGTESPAPQLPRQLWNGLLEGLVWTVYVLFQFPMGLQGVCLAHLLLILVQLFKPMRALVRGHRLHWMRSTAVSLGVAPSLSPSILGAQISSVLQCKYKPFPQICLVWAGSFSNMDPVGVRTNCVYGFSGMPGCPHRAYYKAVSSQRGGSGPQHADFSYTLAWVHLTGTLNFLVPISSSRCLKFSSVNKSTTISSCLQTFWFPPHTQRYQNSLLKHYTSLLDSKEDVGMHSECFLPSWHDHVLPF